MKRAVQRELENPLAKYLLSTPLPEGSEIEADYVKSFENYAIGDFDRGRTAESFAYCMKALGLEGVRSGEDSYIIFSGRHGFGKKQVGTVPANAPLCYHIRVEEVY